MTLRETVCRRQLNNPLISEILDPHKGIVEGKTVASSGFHIDVEVQHDSLLSFEILSNAFFSALLVLVRKQKD